MADEKVFSLKFLFHRMVVDPAAFRNSGLLFEKPCLAIKFLNFPTFKCESKLFIFPNPQSSSPSPRA